MAAVVLVLRVVVAYFHGLQSIYVPGPTATYLLLDNIAVLVVPSPFFYTHLITLDSLCKVTALPGHFFF